MKKWTALLVTVLCMALLFSACGQTPADTATQEPAPESTAPESTAPESTTPESTEPESTTPESTEPEAEAPTKTIKIGATFHSTYHEFFAEMIKGMEDEAQKLGVDLQISDENMDVAKQNSTMETFVQQGFDAIILLAIDPEALNAAAGDAMEKGVPVVTVDGAISNEENYVTFIGSDSYAMGKMAGEAAKSYIETEMGGKATVAGIGWLSHPISVKRVEGFKEIVTTLPGVTWAGEQEADSRDKALTVSENMLQANKDINLFYGGNEGTVLGELATVESAGMLDSIKICGIDISNDVIRAIEEGKIPFVVTQQPEEMGRESIRACLKAINGETVEKNITIDSTVVTKDNVADFKK